MKKYFSVPMNVHQKLSKQTEGLASFYAGIGKITKGLPVFYNPVMKLNRDIGILLLKNSGKDIVVSLPLAGSGVRGLRYLKELKNIKCVSFNDMNPKAISSIKKGIKLNKIPKSKIRITNKEANEYLQESKGYNYIDIDPFGSPNPFLDNSIKKISRDGILAVTATDVAALAGTYINTCKRNYWALPMRNELMHEIGIRILIRKIQLQGAQYDKALTPIYAHSSSHYVRVYLKSEKGKTKADKIISQHKYITYCKKCMKREIVHIPKEKCTCKSKQIYAGPIWTGQLWDKKLASQMLKSADKKNKETYNLVKIINDEAKIEEVGFFDFHKICKVLKKKSVPSRENILKELKKLGRNASVTHFRPEGIRTNANEKEFIKIIKKL